jgi:putative oxidoreductase
MLFILRLAIGALFLYSGLTKIRGSYEFLAAVNQYQLTGPVLTVVVAALVPWLEIIVGACLIGGLLTQGAMIGAALLCGMFAMAVSLAWLRGLHISCGCFGGSGRRIDGFVVARSIGLLLLTGFGCLLALHEPLSTPPRR